MKPLYSHIAGQNRERLGALSDGLFAIAMTLLVLEIHVPHVPPGGDGALFAALEELLPKFLTFTMSFLTAGIFWVGQQTQLNNLRSVNRDLVWIHLGFLLFVSLLPFSTALLGEYILSRTALLIYWGNLAALGGMLLVSWRYAEANALVLDDLDPHVSSAIKRRILLAQLLYAGAAALCFISPIVSIAVILVLQLNYAIGPRIPWLDKV